jgi:DNA-binding response OmpR family regulator
VNAVVEVTLVPWPPDESKLAQLRFERRPVLYLVPLDLVPPVIDDPLEDWVRSMADPLEVQVRVESLRRRASRLTAPQLDESGRLHVGDKWIAVSDIEQRLLRPLVNNYGRIVPVAALRSAVWTNGDVPRNRLDVHILRLRRQLRPLNLTITNVRGKGFTLSLDVDSESPHIG